MVYQLVVQSFLKVQDRHCLVSITEEDETTHIIIEEEEEMIMVKVRLSRDIGTFGTVERMIRVWVLQTM